MKKKIDVNSMYKILGQLPAKGPWTICIVTGPNTVRALKFGPKVQQQLFDCVYECLHSDANFFVVAESFECLGPAKPKAKAKAKAKAKRKQTK